MTAPVHLLKGADDVLRGEALTELLDELVGDGDRSLLVDEFDLDSVKLGAAIDAAQTVPFLTDRRVVVVRRFGRFSKADDVAELVAYLDDPLGSSSVVLVWERSVKAAEGGEGVAAKPMVPPSLTKAIKACGGSIVDAAPGAKLDAWVPDQLRSAGLDLEPRAVRAVVDSLGEDAGALVELIGRLKGVAEPGATMTVTDVEPLLGRAGGVVPWDLTDAIDRGDVPTSIDLLRRMLDGGDRHPLAVMAILQSHYLRMLKLDGAGVRGEKEAAKVLGLKGSTFPAKKALANVSKLGGAGVRRCVSLVAQADVDLRGARAWPGDLVMEVLVARLATTARTSRR